MIALGIGFASPLALAGVVVHVLGHAIAKSLGFYAATPLLVARPRASGHPVGGVAHGSRARHDDGDLTRRTRRPAALPAVRERGADRGRRLPAGHDWVAAIAAAVLLALGFLGLAHALIETTVGRPRGTGGQQGPAARARRPRGRLARPAGPDRRCPWLPASDLVDTLVQGLT